MTSVEVTRGEVWLTDFDPVIGHEQGGRRPCLIVSHDVYNHGPWEMVVVMPLTTKAKATRIRVLIEPPEGGLRSSSYIMPDMIRAISTQRLVSKWGAVSAETLLDVETKTKALLQFR